MNRTVKLPFISLLSILLILALTFLVSCEKENKEKNTQVFIDSPPYNRHFIEKELPLTLKGTAVAFNGDFSDKIKWTSDRDGELGVGKEISVSLSRGAHTINAYADNGHIPGSYDIPVTIDANPKEMKVVPKEKIIEVNDSDQATFIVNRTKQVITDTSTGLMWDRTPDATFYTYAQAVEYSKKSNLGGFNDWRLPTFEEFSDIHNLYYDGRDAILQDEFSPSECKFWTQTTVDKKSGAHKYVIKLTKVYRDKSRAFVARKSYAETRSELYVRLVRRAQ